jgi:hypothetical protein
MRERYLPAPKFTFEEVLEKRSTYLDAIESAALAVQSIAVADIIPGVTQGALGWTLSVEAKETIAKIDENRIAATIRAALLRAD